MYSGHSQRASEELHKATSLDPTAIPAWESIAALHLNFGDVLEAAETYENLVSARSSPAHMVHFAVNAVMGLGWKGLSSPPELQGCATFIVPTNQAVSLQLTLAKEQGLQEKQREFLWRISDAYDKAGYLDVAENRLKELLEQQLSEEQQLEALCFLADIQVDCWLNYKGVFLSYHALTVVSPSHRTEL